MERITHARAREESVGPTAPPKERTDQAAGHGHPTARSCASAYRTECTHGYRHGTSGRVTTVATKDRMKRRTGE
jgi:hypothetical protein